MSTQPRDSTAVHLPELALHEHGVLAHLGLTADDIRLDRSGALSSVRSAVVNGDHQFIAKVRTNLGNAAVFTLTCSIDDEARLRCAVETMLFTLAVAHVHVRPSIEFITGESAQMTILCAPNDIRLIRHEVHNAAQFGCLSAFAPISFQPKRMSRVCALGHFPTALMAAAAVALVTRVHLAEHALMLNSTNSNANYTKAATAQEDAKLQKCHLAPRIRTMLMEAHKASTQQYHNFWSSMIID